MLPVLTIFLVIGVCSAIYWGFWHGTRTKLQNEEEKSDFLESKFKHLKNLEFKKDDIEHDLEIEKIIKIFNENGFKKGIVKEIICTLPYDEKNLGEYMLVLKQELGLLMIRRRILKFF